jgi:predicted RNase H-like nuclease (RuvC/YqgF family)
MTQLNEEHFEVIDRNKDISLQRTKIKYLEDRISKLERVLESHAKCIGELRGTESRIHDLISLKGDNNA